MNEPHEPTAVPGPLERHARSLAFGIFILALGVLAGAGAREASSRERDSLLQQGQSARQVIALAADQRETMLKDMRGLLTAMQSIMDAASKMDVPRMRSLAQAAGTASLTGQDPAIQAQLPDAFRKEAAETRAEFDALSQAIRGFTARDTVLAYMARISERCVGCHAKYQLGTKE